MRSIKEDVETAVVPPPCLEGSCTVRITSIIVTVVRTEGMVVVGCHGISCSCCPLSLADMETVVVFWAIHSELLVRPVDMSTTSGLHVDTKLHLLPGGQAVDVPEAKPELTLQITKPLFICLPVFGEVLRTTTDPSLDDYPAATITFHVTSHTQFCWLQEWALVAADIIDLIDTSAGCGDERLHLQKK